MKQTFFALVLITAIFVCSPLRAAQVDAIDISNRAYGPAVLTAINQAKNEILVAMYSVYLREGEKDNPVVQLVQALIDARQRGVLVRVFLDKTPATGQSNDEAYRILKNKGVEVHFIQSTVKLHAKLIVIDRKITIDGSANWTKNAVETNLESNDLADSVPLARSKLDFFKEVEKNIVPDDHVDPVVMATIKVRDDFLTDKKLGARMVMSTDTYSFDFYMLLLRNGGETISIDYAAWARAIGLAVETKNSTYRVEIRRIVKNLKDKYGLIDYTLGPKGELSVSVAPYQGTSVNVPCGYWDYGLNIQLSLREKFAYLVALREQALALPDLYWHWSLPALESRYYIDDGTFSFGLRGLKKLDIIEVHHSWIDDDNYTDRLPNEYRVKTLISPQEEVRQWSALEARFDAGSVAKARALATLLDEGNCLDSVEYLIGLIKQYGLPRVEKSVNTVAAYQPDNPMRSIEQVEKLCKG
jgi:hypothetical protein